ncbi:MAG: hypothetical protein CFE43_10345 [Burkholderiales bacterium PBB3]|nr:MAG: hypothetical protein CFE43_10345 [Burkholderiales bacterium PBB3]
MQSLDLRVLKDALQWRQSGYAVTLITVIETWGSAPRPAGAMLALRGDGMVSGSVSGGCVEDDLIARTRAALPQQPPPGASVPALITYGVTKDEAARFGLPCGGTLRLLQEQLTDTGWLVDLLSRIQNHELVARTVTLSTGEITLSTAHRGQSLVFDDQALTCAYGPQWRLLLIGAGQLSQAVAQMALLLDFEVLVCDPREEYVETLVTSLPSVQLVPGMPDDAVRDLRADAHTAILALTHDPKLDDMALLEALQSNAFYVGALGSRRNQAARRERLGTHFGLSEADLNRLHGPVGLNLGAKTPAEIAVSVVAEIVQAKCQGTQIASAL